MAVPSAARHIRSLLGRDGQIPVGRDRAPAAVPLPFLDSDLPSLRTSCTFQPKTLKPYFFELRMEDRGLRIVFARTDFVHLQSSIFHPHIPSPQRSHSPPIMLTIPKVGTISATM